MSTSQIDLTDAEKRFLLHLAWWLEHDRTADSIPANFIHRREVHETLAKLGLPRAATIARFVSLGLLAEDFQDVTTDALGHRIPLSATVYKILGGVVDVARKILSENPNAKPETRQLPSTNPSPLSCVELANKHGLDPEKLRKKLERLRQERDDVYVTVENKRRNQPKYLYYESAVEKLLDGLKTELS